MSTYDGMTDEQVARGSHPGVYVANSQLSDSEMQPLVERYEAAREKQGKADFVDWARYSFQLLSEAGIPCSNMNVQRERLTIIMLVDAVESDPIVAERTKDGNTVNTVARMTSTEKAALRNRVGELTAFIGVGQSSFVKRGN